jgi:hypothetical protein
MQEQNLEQTDMMAAMEEEQAAAREPETEKAVVARAGGGRKAKAPGLKISRRFTETGEDVWNSVEWEKRTAAITDEQGNVVFEQTDIARASSTPSRTAWRAF